MNIRVFSIGVLVVCVCMNGFAQSGAAEPDGGGSTVAVSQIVPAEIPPEEVVPAITEPVQAAPTATPTATPAATPKKSPAPGLIDPVPLREVKKQIALPLDTLANASKIFETSDILVFYGHPASRNMGILGRFSKDDLAAKLEVLADDYRTAGGKNIVTGFYIIYGTCWPEGEIGKIGASTLVPWIEYARDHNMLVFLDHQIGKYDPVASLKTMLPYLKYPNVHLALDPEWRTTKPMKEFGYVTGAEINAAQEAMEQYMDDNGIEGERMLVIHQFREVMLKNRAAVKADYKRVRLVHCMDGVGTPGEKRDTYAFNARAANMPLKSFKLFYDFKLPGVLVDSPLLSADEVFALDPRPRLIMYQ